MAKKLVITIFLMMFASALSLFLFRRAEVLGPAAIGGKAPEPRIALENFSVHRYESGKQVSLVSGKQAQLFDPNVLEVEGDVYAERFRPDGRIETARSERATAFFSAEALSQVLGGAELDRVVFETNVQILVRDMLLETNSASYLAGNQTLESEEPVEMKSSRRHSYGDSGFLYEMNRQKLKMTGNISGTFTQ